MTDMPLSERNRKTRARLREVVSGLDAETLATTVPACPEWTVNDLVCHLAYVAKDIASGNRPGDDFAAWTRAQVEQGRGQPLAEVLDVWEEWGSQVDAALDANPAIFNALMDITIHEMDARAAVGLAPVGDDEHLAFLVDTILQRLPMFTGDRGLPGLDIVVGGGSAHVGGDGDTAVAVDGFEFGRGVFGRRSDAQMAAWQWTGDPTPFLGGAITLFPPRTTPLIE